MLLYSSALPLGKVAVHYLFKIQVLRAIYYSDNGAFVHCMAVWSGLLEQLARHVVSALPLAEALAIPIQRFTRQRSLQSKPSQRLEKFCVWQQ